MNIRDRLMVSLRHMKSGFVGVILVILATGIGIALAASTSAFIQGYHAQTKRILNHPVYREVRVRILGFDETEIAAPVQEIELENIRSSFLSMDDMKRAAESAPAVEHVFVLQRHDIITTAALMRFDAKGEKGIEKTVDVEPNVVLDLPLDEFPGIQTSNDFFNAYGLKTARGSLFSQEDLDAGNLVIVFGSTLADTLFPEGNAIGSKISLLSETFTVIGILEPTGITDPSDMTPYNDMAFIPQASLEKGWNKRIPITDVRFTVADSKEIQRAQGQLSTYFESVHPDASFLITASMEQLQRERQTLSRVIVVLVFLTAVGLFIAAINLLNLMLIRIIKHTKGIGIMRALGSTRGEIFRQFMTESIIMCVFGAALGMIAAPQFYKLLQTAIVAGDRMVSQALLPDLLPGAVVGLLFSIAFGLYPAVLAKNTNTTAAIRAE